MKNASTEDLPLTIPGELKKRRQWVCWNFEPRDGKLTKVPYSPHGGPASVIDPATWASYGAAMAACRRVTTTA